MLKKIFKGFLCKHSDIFSTEVESEINSLFDNDLASAIFMLITSYITKKELILFVDCGQLLSQDHETLQFILNIASLKESSLTKIVTVSSGHFHSLSNILKHSECMHLIKGFTENEAVK